MTVIRVQTSELQFKGPVVDILIAPSRAAADVDPRLLTRSYQADALIDTGAEMTVVRAGIPGLLGLYPVGTKYVNTPATNHNLGFLYSVRIVFSNQHVIDQVVVVELPLKDQPIQCMIGRDILRHAVFTYRGPKESFTLSF